MLTNWTPSCHPLPLLPQAGPVALRASKAAMSCGADLDLQSGLRLEEACYAQVQGGGPGQGRGQHAASSGLICTEVLPSDPPPSPPTRAGPGHPGPAGRPGGVGGAPAAQVHRGVTAGGGGIGALRLLLCVQSFQRSLSSLLYKHEQYVSNKTVSVIISHQWQAGWSGWRGCRGARTTALCAAAPRPARAPAVRPLCTGPRPVSDSHRRRRPLRALAPPPTRCIIMPEGSCEQHRSAFRAHHSEARPRSPTIT